MRKRIWILICASMLTMLDLENIIKMNIDAKENDYQGNIEEMNLLPWDSSFCLKLNDGGYLIVDHAGKIKKKSELQGSYLLDEYNHQVYDLFGWGENCTMRFIKNAEHEKVLGTAWSHKKKGSVVIVCEEQETSDVQKMIIKILDANGNQCYQIDDNNSYFEGKTMPVWDSIMLEGEDSVALIAEDTGERIYFNTDTGEITDNEYYAWGYVYNTGYYIMEENGIHYIVDNYGEKIAGDETTEGILKDASDIRGGLFWNKSQKKFYDINLRERIDLSDYNVTEIGGFEDSYCAVETEDKDGKKFCGIIDKTGKWLIELTDTLDFSEDSYEGKVTDSKIILGKRLYDVNTKEFIKIPEEIAGGISVGDEYCGLYNKYYGVSDGIFYCYDPDTNQLEPVDIH